MEARFTARGPVEKPLGKEQERFFHLAQFNPANPEIYITNQVTVRGDLDRARLEAALSFVVAGEPMLRSVFRAEPRPGYSILPAVDAQIEFHDLAGDEAKLKALVEGEIAAREAFDISTGPLFKAKLVRMADRYVFLFRVHHIACDAMSSREVLARIFRHYEVLGGGVLPMDSGESAAFDAYVGYERSLENEREAHQAYWREKLKDPPGALEWAGGGRAADSVAESVLLRLPGDVSAKLTELSRQKGVTPYFYLATVLNVLIYRLTGANDVVIGAPFASRTESEFQNTVGVLISWMVFRTRLDAKDPFNELVRRVQTDILDSMDHATLGFMDLQALAPKAKGPLFRAVINQLSFAPLPPVRGLELAVETLPWGRTHFDLSLTIDQQAGATALCFVFNSAAFNGAGKKVAEGFVTILSHFLADDARVIGTAPAPELNHVPPVKAVPKIKLAMAATITLDPIVETLQFWSGRLNLGLEPDTGRLNQIFQDLLDPTSALAANTGGLNACLVRLEDWKDPRKNAEEFIGAVKNFSERQPAPLIVVMLRPSPTTMRDAGRAHLMAELEQRVASDLSGSSRVHLITQRDVEALYPVEAADDEDADKYAQAPYTRAYYCALGTALARKAHAILRPAPKVLVLDCDNTLWKGVVGEDGVEGIVIDSGHRALQEFAVRQMQSGVLLALASKNNEADVWEVFEKRKDMVLKREHIVASRINWAPKSSNLKAMAKELNLGIDSFMFLDDSPVECAEVRQNSPEVLALQVPSGRPEQTSDFVRHLWILDERKVTDADRKRTRMYVENAQREKERTKAQDLTAFIASLELKTNFVPCDSETLARISQMTMRTNQFNATTIRRSEAEIAALQKSGSHKIVGVDVSDRFGDYGLVGLMIFSVQENAIAVDTFLLSCRALGRGVEQRMLHYLGEQAHAGKLKSVAIPFHVSAKNRPIAQFLDAVGSNHRREIRPGEKFLYELPVDVALKAVEKPMTIDFADEEKKSGPAAAIPLVDPSVWTQIALSLTDIEAITGEIRKNSTTIRPGAVSYEAPRNAAERKIAAVWSEVLNVGDVGINDNYFSLGGDSMRSVEVASKLKKLGLTVTPIQVQEHPTVARLAVVAAGSEAAPLILVSSPQQGRDIFSEPPGPTSIPQAFVLKNYERENPRGGNRRRNFCYHFQQVFTFKVQNGPVNGQALIEANQIAMSRYATFYTCFRRGAADGEYTQFCKPQVRAKVKLVDLREMHDELFARYGMEFRAEALNDMAALETALQQRFIDDLFAEDLRDIYDPFDDAREVYRGVFLLRSDNEFSWFSSCHHSIGDGWSMQVWLNDLLALYQAIQRGDLEFVKQFKEQSERELGAGRNSVRELALYEDAWRRQNAGASQNFWRAYLGADADRKDLERLPRQKVPKDDNVMLKWKLDPSDISALVEVRKKLNVSVRAVYLAAYVEFLSQMLGTERPAIAVVTSGRNDAISQIESAVGLFWRFCPLIGVVNSDKKAQIAKTHADLIQLEANNLVDLQQIFDGRSPEQLLVSSFIFSSFYNAEWFTEQSPWQQTGFYMFDRYHWPFNVRVHLEHDRLAGYASVSWSPEFYSRNQAVGLMEGFLEQIRAAGGWA